jgi:GntR family transcriptional regulator
MAYTLNPGRRSRVTAQYKIIASDLRERIATGEYQAGDALPLMRDTAAAYGVSDITVRKAYMLLIREGLLETRGRGGTYVLTHPDRVRLIVRNRQVERDELGYYSGPEVQHWRALPHPEGEHTRIATQPVPADVAEILGVAPGTALTVRKRIIGDPDIPEHRQLADSWIPSWVTDELPALAGDTGPGGMYDRVEEWAGRPLRWREEVSTRIPAPAEAEALRMSPTTPILRVVRVTILPADSLHFSDSEEGDGQVVEVQDIRMSGGIFAVGYPLPRSTEATWPVAPATSNYYASEPDTDPE